MAVSDIERGIALLSPVASCPELSISMGSPAPLHSSPRTNRPWYPDDVNEREALDTVVVLLPGVSPFDCRGDVGPGIFLHGGRARATVGHGGEFDVTRWNAAGYP